MSRLEFGIFDPFRGFEFDGASSIAEVYEQHIREAQLAEQLGYRYYFLIEHQSAVVGQITSPAVYLTAVAQHTSAIRLGTMIFPLPFYHPIRLAQDAAMLDHLSHGRLEFGFGLGTSQHEFQRWHVPYSQRREMAEEAMEIILESWLGESVTSQGKYWAFDEALPVPKPYQKPHPPIWVAAHSLPSFEYAARKNFNVAQNIDVDPVIARNFESWRGLWKAQEHPGPMPHTFLTRSVWVAETDEQAREEAEDSLLLSYTLGAEKIKNSRIGPGTREDTPRGREANRVFQGMATSYDFWVDNGLALVGSPDTVVRQLKDSQRRLGYDVFCANFRFGPMPNELVEKSIRLFGQEVMPAFV